MRTIVFTNDLVIAVRTNMCKYKHLYMPHTHVCVHVYVPHIIYMCVYTYTYGTCVHNTYSEYWLICRNSFSKNMVVINEFGGLTEYSLVLV